MTISADVIDAMVAAGCSAKQLAAAIRADERAGLEKLAEKREKDRIRQRNHRARNAMSHVTERDERDPPNGLEGFSEPLPKTLNPHTHSSLRSSGDAPAHMEFHANFWPNYPNKVGKPDAERAFVKARRRAPLAAILAGLEAYRLKADDRPWCNPATWLNGDRWNDKPAVVPKQGAPPEVNGMAAAARRRIAQLQDEENRHDGPAIEGSNQPRNNDWFEQAVLSLTPPKDGG